MQTGLRSGSLITDRLAAEQGREVLALVELSLAGRCEQMPGGIVAAA